MTETTPNSGKLSITHEDLSAPEVDAKVEAQAASARAREHYDRQVAREPDRHQSQRFAAIWYNTIFYSAFFGLLGALLGWGIGLAVYRADPTSQARELTRIATTQIELYKDGRISPEEYHSAMRGIEQLGRDNRYFQILSNTSLTEAQRLERMDREQWMQFIRNVLFYGLCGLMIAACLSMAEAVVSRNIPGAVLYGSVGAMVGLAGGIVVALFINHFTSLVLRSNLAQSIDSDHRLTLARTATWAILGLFLAMGPGIVLRNPKRLLIGLLGGLIGGVLGGLLYDPIIAATRSEALALLAAVGAIGLLSGLGTGLIENAAKTGWVKVTEGLIAGKQFILYRNPTYIGSAPNCEIYLFKDRQVGKRHAAIHVAPGGFELEDLPLGSPTLINGQPVTRARLHVNDHIQVGGTTFVFHEKQKS